MYDTYPRNELCGRCEHEWVSRHRQRSVNRQSVKSGRSFAVMSLIIPRPLILLSRAVLQPPLVCFRSSWVVYIGTGRLTLSIP